MTGQPIGIIRYIEIKRSSNNKTYVQQDEFWVVFTVIDVNNRSKIWIFYILLK